MIYSLEGKISKIENDFIVLNVTGIGYKVFVGSLSLEIKNNKDLFLYIHQAVRETALDLFGFKTEAELKLFELLISISGIGPKVALGILSVTTPASLKRAVISENTDELTKVSGIGQKVAKKIILELGNKVDKIKLSESEENQNFDLETYETLEALGFDRTQIRTALSEITATDSGEKIKQALKNLGK
jgi:Holliday junction DNA helicase RuvA